MKPMKNAGSALGFLIKLLPLASVYFLTEILLVLLLKPNTLNGMWFGMLWALLLASVSLLLPRLGGRIVFGVTFYFFCFWSLAQAVYYGVFGRMMWLTDMGFAGEGAPYLADIIGDIPALWWIGGILILVLGGLLIWKFPKAEKSLRTATYWLVIALSVAGLCFLPKLIFVTNQGEDDSQLAHRQAAYNTMYDARSVYDSCGFYQLTARDTWVNFLYPLTPAYQKELSEQSQKLDAYFAQRGEKEDNAMTGAFKGKNVILVLMESMDDWMITEEDTPTLYKLMQEGVNFTNFYTPGYGTARTLNAELCVNTGIYLPTNGRFFFNYVNNSYGQSFAARLSAAGYSAEVFHYNSGDFYSRSALEVSMGYDAYNSYMDYTDDEDKLYDDCLLFEIPELTEQFFREGNTFNTIITRSAHLSYKYREPMSQYALKKYPSYEGKYASEEEDCARVKAKLVDDMFARLMQELEERGQLENTVIIGVTDHYTYGYKNMTELYSMSGVADGMLLEKTPCFVWSADCTPLTVEKTLNTSDFLPTMLNLLGIDSPYPYLGQDAFDDRYEGYALFANGSWICDGWMYNADDGSIKSLTAEATQQPSKQWVEQMCEKAYAYINASNLLLTSNYYRK